MVSYKVLIILTVLFIINCDCDDEIKQKVQECPLDTTYNLSFL
ncbi:unnamed protein product [Aphis gossypii]|uniref:Uncharacterized protein n=1 Tax=Aphis gossypii TaxID=80765 RepID=A0A9P0NNJ6_APHGO|nr:unnamed protein product [Aphis gossypii]